MCLARMISATRAGHSNEARQIRQRGRGEVRESDQNKPGLRQAIFGPRNGRQILITKLSINAGGFNEHLDLIGRAKRAIEGEEIQYIRSWNVKGGSGIAGKNCPRRIRRALVRKRLSAVG